MNRTTDFNRLNDNGLNEMQIANPAIKQRRIATATQRTQRTSLLRQLIVLAVMLIIGGTATGQSVIMNGNYFLTHSEDGTTVNPAATTTFNPATCLWVFAQDNYIRTANSAGQAITTTNNNYLQYTSTSVALGTDGFNWYRARNNTEVYHRTGNQWNRTYYYLRLNGTTWQISSTDNNNGTLYAVTISAIPANVTNPTISGADVLTATGTSGYSAPGASYRTGYTNYRFRDADHYCDANGNSITPANATIGAATWSLTDNDYATVNESTGAVTVSSLPESDIELTLTVTYPVTGGTPVVPVGVTLTATKTITLQGTIPPAPTISVSGTTVTMATNAAGTTTIRYTLDGTDPTTTTGTVYNGPIDISDQTTSPVVIKAITVRNGNASSVTEQSVQLTLPAPVITADASAGTATITCANADATIYYTTDGTTPSATNGTAYTDQLSGLPLMTNLQAIAVRDGWNDSPVTSAILTLPSGTDGTTVTLFDYEPHSWSYYSDPDCPIRSLNPADVKITYYGDGQTENNMTTTDTKDIPTSFGTKATGVRVSATEAENTFVYYKTLERTNGEGAASKAAANGAAMYTTIPNPFQVRPTGQNNGNQSITLATRRVYLEYNTAVDYGGYTNGTVTCQYYDINNNSQTLTFSSSGNTYIEAKVGTQITVTATSGRFTYYGTNYYNRATITALYNNNSGTQIATATSANNNTNTTTQTSSNLASSTVTVSAGTYRGFYAWRVKSKSASITSITDADGNAFANNIIPAETDIRINTTSEYGNEIEFEALWAQAYATTGSTNLPYAVSSSVPSAYERNFHILNTSTEASNFQKTYPCTVIGREPNSTTLNTTRAVTGGFTAAAATKFEELNITNATGSTWTANNHDLIIGRGCTGTVYYVRGYSGNLTNNANYKIRVESGTITHLSFADGSLGDPGNASSTWSGTNNSIISILGSDYDRASNDNDKLTVTGTVIMGAAATFSNQTVTSKTLDVTVKSGKYFTSLNGNMGDGDAEKSFYIGIANVSNSKVGERRLTIEGGELANVAGGVDAGNQNANNGVRSITMRMKGGIVNGAVYGGAAVSPASGDRYMVFTGGTVKGWIGGGCNGVLGTNSTTGGQTHGVSYVYIGGNTKVGGSAIINGSIGGTVFGAGKGSGGTAATEAESGQMTYGTNLVIADNTDVMYDAYGGGNYGYSLVNTNVQILGGTVHGSVFGGSNENNGPIINILMKDGLVENGIYGGSNTRGNISGDVTIQVDGGTVGQGNAGNGIFGGGYGQTTTVNGNVSVTLGTCNAGDVTVYGDVYGGSALGTVNDATSDKTTVSLYNGTIRGGIYGGGYGPGGVAANVNGAVEVKVFGGSVLCSESDPQGEAGSGSVFGCNNAGGAPQSTVKVDIYKTDAAPGEGQYALHAVYGGGNKANYDGTPVVTIHGCNSSIEYVYGGGNASDVRGTNVTIWGGTIGNAFGGGNGYSVTGNHTNQSADHYNPGANITTEGTNLKIYGGTIGAAFGGSNQYGTINDGVQVTVDSREESNEGRPACVDTYTTCPLSIGELYSGGNEAALISSRNPLDYITPNKIIVSLSCSANIGMLFGGAKAANYVGNINLVVDGGTYTKVFGGNNKGGTITGDVTVTFNGGSAEEVYGGCNESGSITGDITVNIDSTNSTCPTRFYVENVYGGGNLAAYGGSPEVNIINGTVQENVYGGGYGSTAEVAGSPAVTVGVSSTEKRALVLGNVFGGGNAAPVSGDTDVKILYNSYIKGNVYGGGNKATVSGDTKVNIGN